MEDKVYPRTKVRCTQTTFLTDHLRPNPGLIPLSAEFFQSLLQSRS